jgi:D-arginine dehydrogenase
VLWAAFDEDGARALRAELVDRADEPDAPVELSLEEAIAWCPVLRRDVLRAAAVTEAACDLDAMALHQAYVRGLRRRGGFVRVAAPVTQLVAVSGGWRVHCGAGEVLYAADVVNAAGAWADLIAGLAGVGGWDCARCAARSSSRGCRTRPACVTRALARCRW